MANLHHDSTQRIQENAARRGRPGPGGVSAAPLSRVSRRSARPSGRRIVELHDFPFFERPVDFTFFDFPNAGLFILLNTMVWPPLPLRLKLPLKARGSTPGGGNAEGCATVAPGPVFAVGDVETDDLLVGDGTDLTVKDILALTQLATSRAWGLARGAFQGYGAFVSAMMSPEILIRLISSRSMWSDVRS